MADLYTFPSAPTVDGDYAMGQPSEDGVLHRPIGVPDNVWSAVESVHDMELVPSMLYREIPVPSSWADYSIGVEIRHNPDFLHSRTHYSDTTFTITDEDGETGLDFEPGVGRTGQSPSGWVMVLYSHSLNEQWNSHWRVVALAQFGLRGDNHTELTSEMYWDYVGEFLRKAVPNSVSGTVSVTHNTVFGAGSTKNHTGCEIRVSWTPVIDFDDDINAGMQITDWAKFIESLVDIEEDVSVEG